MIGIANIPDIPINACLIKGRTCVVVVVVVVVVGRHKDKAPVQTTRSSLQDEMTKPPWNMVVHCIWVS